ncbi:MAG: hypothetical protein L0H31_16365, partial [Nocardioidaceae bacterium]|nr:hypothetical protein [Nocardioidaceae bacterium]
LAHSVHAHVVIVRRHELFIEHRVATGPRRGRPGLASVVRARGDPDPGLGQDGAGRLDPMLITVLVDEGIDIGQRRSSSA